MSSRITELRRFLLARDARGDKVVKPGRDRSAYERGGRYRKEKRNPKEQTPGGRPIV